MPKNKKVFILGMAKSGYEAAKLLSKDNKVLKNDKKEQNKKKRGKTDVRKTDH